MKFLITGAGRGIGYELAMFALEDGHEVIALVRDPFKGGGLTQAKKDFPGKVHVLKGDVTSSEDIENVYVEIEELLGDSGIDVLVNNAGIMTDSDEAFTQLNFEDLQLTFLSNTFAPLMVAKQFLPLLKKAVNPKLVNITSLMGSIRDNSSGGYYAYRMSKAALNMFNKSFSVDFPEIVALTLHPGWVRTQMGGPDAPTLPRESARGLYKVIKEAGREQSGHFYDFTGKELPF